MNSNSEDFPVPVSPTRRTVYGALSLFFDVLMIPFLRDLTSLEFCQNTYKKAITGTYLIAGASPSSSEVGVSPSS